MNTLTSYYHEYFHKEKNFYLEMWREEMYICKNQLITQQYEKSIIFFNSNRIPVSRV